MLLEFRLIVAIPEKRYIGTQCEWLGLRFHVTMNALTIPPAKLVRALAGLRKAISGAMTHAEYRSLAGLLVHLHPFAAMDPSALYQLWRPLGKVGGPEDLIQHEWLPRALLERWISLLTDRAGVPFSHAIARTAEPVPHESIKVVFHMMTDAAKAGARIPGLGGFLHGLWWAVALKPRDVVGPLAIPIPVLEFVAIAVGIIVFAPVIGVAAMAIYSDSLTSTDVLAKRAHAELMQLVHCEVLGKLRVYPLLYLPSGLLFTQRAVRCAAG